MDNNRDVILGIDVGSISANIVTLDSKAQIREEHYIRTYGRPLATVKSFLQAFIGRIHPSTVKAVAFTGTAGQIIAQRTGCHFENEIVSQVRAVEHLHPHIKTVIEMGGQDSKLILLEQNLSTGRLKIKDFSMNSVCAAGTGSFLDQQAYRLGLTIEQFSQLALRSENPPRIAGRCSVFAKTDMIHLQQIATSDFEIVAGLCLAVARNFKSSIGRGFSFEQPVAFQGGVAANVGMRRAFLKVLDIKENEFIIPQYFASMGAIGTALLAWENSRAHRGFPDLSLFDTEPAQVFSMKKEEALTLSPGHRKHSDQPTPTVSLFSTKKTVDAYLGIDVGSISTNLVVIDCSKQVLAKRYLMTAGRPIEAIKRGLQEIGEEIGSRVFIKGVGTTGSGRYLTGDFVGADVIKNEITAQATAAVHIDPRVDTIFEIGGQDSKYISIENGVVVDFEMNKVCAAGTGSFLEEQAERLGISIKEEFARLALSANAPVSLGERCTVFMESDMVHFQQRGASRDNLLAGLCISIVLNYLNKVVGDRKIGNTIFFQGGTAFNLGVVAAFEKVLGKEVIVPPNHEVTGAIGAALLAMNEKPKQKSNFKGFALSQKSYELKSFECHGCSNMCEIKKLTVKGEKPLFYGSRCERYEIGNIAKKKALDIPDLFAERESLLEEYSQYTESKETQLPKIGIPLALFQYELLPFFTTFFQSLGYQVIISDKTHKGIIHQGVEAVVAETCFPVKVAHGHIIDLINKGVDKIFIPSIISMPRIHPAVQESFACPYVQAIPYTIASAINFQKEGVDIIRPVLHLGESRKKVEHEFLALRKDLKKSAAQIQTSLQKAYMAQEAFSNACKNIGRQILSSLKKDQIAMVIVSRPYNGCDTGINLQVPQKLKEMGIVAIPMDFLPLEDLNLAEEWAQMYWKYGQKILASTHFIKNHPQLFAIYLTNFGCGPDSFITHFFKEKLKGIPYLMLEIDEHSADAGTVTRIEAFIDSLTNKQKEKQQLPAPTILPTRALNDRLMYIPRMSDHALTLSAAFEACGVSSRVILESDEETIRLGRKFTSGRECFPCVLTTGDMVKTVQSPDFDPEHSAFFMPSGRGPCRFGQYNRFHRLVLKELGCPEVPVFAPIQDEALYENFNGLGRDFSTLAWQGIVAVDILQKKLRETRPYELYRGEADAVYQDFLKKICFCISTKQNIRPVLQDARKAFEAISVDKNNKKPVIGIVGEIYIRANRFGNENLIRKIEKMGGEAWLAPISEWILYTNYTAKKLCKEKKDFQRFMKLLLKNKFQQAMEHRMEKLFRGSIKNYGEPSTEKLLGLAMPYIDESFEGEAILSIGKAIDFTIRGAHGIITTMPFTCMPGTIVNAVLKQCRKDYQEFPVLNIAYDGQQETNTQIKLETFIHQVQEYKRFKNN